jgi:hypothetical protein
MAVGRIDPNKPEQNVLSNVVSAPGPLGTREAVEKMEVLEPEAKSFPEIEVEAEMEPTGEEVHQKARELSHQTVEGQARLKEGQDVTPKTGKEVMDAVKEDKQKAHEESDADEVLAAQQKVDEEVRKVKEEEAKDREAMDKAMQENAQAIKEEAREEAVKVQEENKAKPAVQPAKLSETKQKVVESKVAASQVASQQQREENKQKTSDKK